VVLGILHGVPDKFVDDVLGATVGPNFYVQKLECKRAAALQLMTIEEGTHNGSRNVVGKFILHTVQNPQNQESVKLNYARFLKDSF
jgi:hypothetical protein